MPRSRSTLAAEQKRRSPEWLETEKQFTGYVKGLAKALGWLPYHTLWSKGSDAGFPDLVLLRDSRMVVAELKTMKGKLTPTQEQWLAAFREAGAEVYVWRPCDRDEIEKVLGGNQ